MLFTEFELRWCLTIIYQNFFVKCSDAFLISPFSLTQGVSVPGSAICVDTYLSNYTLKALWSISLILYLLYANLIQYLDLDVEVDPTYYVLKNTQ